MRNVFKPASMKISMTLAVVALALVLAARSNAPAQTAAPKPGSSPERQRVYAEIEATFGFVPGFLQTMSDVSLEDEWKTLKAVQMEPGPIPNKYRELIGLGIAASRGCEYCTYFHTQFARLNGASEAEIEDAVHFAKSNVGWSTYLHGMQYDLGQFKKDVDRIVSHAQAMQKSASAK